jgi:hypothetical protein
MRPSQPNKQNRHKARVSKIKATIFFDYTTKIIVTAIHSTYFSKISKKTFFHCKQMSFYPAFLLQKTIAQTFVRLYNKSITGTKVWFLWILSCIAI